MFSLLIPFVDLLPKYSSNTTDPVPCAVQITIKKRGIADDISDGVDYILEDPVRTAIASNKLEII